MARNKGRPARKGFLHQEETSQIQIKNETIETRKITEQLQNKTEQL